jgi:hypothetical protein
MKPVGAGGHRLNVILPDRTHADMIALGRETRRSLTELVRLGLGLVRVAVEAERSGNRLMVATEGGVPIKEIVLPQ